ncbi:MAG: hypothetical protein ABIP75_07450 [Pyrinomonadaceae bacterium]
MSVIRPMIASVLVLWVSGALCFSVCGRQLMQAGLLNTDAPAAASPMPMTAGNHDCCRRNRGQANSTSLTTSLVQTAGDSNCAYQRPSSEAARKFHAPMAIATEFSIVLLTPPVASDAATYVFSITRLPDRGGTHKRNCVFLI